MQTIHCETQIILAGQIVRILPKDYYLTLQEIAEILALKFENNATLAEIRQIVNILETADVIAKAFGEYQFRIG